MSRMSLKASVVVLAVTWATSAWATVAVRLEPASQTVDVGSMASVNLIADFGTDKVIGWGLDLSFDHSVLTQVGLPTIGPWWDPGFAPDGDGLTGAVNTAKDPDGDGFKGSISGNGVLLATVTFLASNQGVSTVAASYTLGDLNEGFPLASSGFALVTLQPAEVNVVPEPFTAVLLVLGGLSMIRRSRSKLD